MSRSSTTRRGIALAACAALAASASVASAAPADPPDTGTGPSTGVSPYVLPAAPGVGILSLLTVDDEPASNGVGMVGIPDGLGAYRQGHDAVVLMNHELVGTAGAVRAHGQMGAFVSRNVIDRKSGEVEKTTDLIKTVRYWDYTTNSWGAAPTGTFTAAFNRFCSASLTDPGQLSAKEHKKRAKKHKHKNKKTGYDGQLFFGNEEFGDTGRAFGVTLNGTATQLPRLGLFSWENTLVADTRDKATVVLGMEDGANGQLRIYVGRKQDHGKAVAKAGLTNGKLHVLDLKDQAVNTDALYRTTFGTGTPVPAKANVIDWKATGVDQNTEAAAQGLSLNRIEDGAFDPRRPNDFYFLTTEGGDTTSVENDPVSGAPVARDGGGFWRLRFKDVSKPSKGMKLTLLRDGSEAPYFSKPDNMGIDTRGHVLIQEDPGGNAHLARILAYDISSGEVATIAEFDPARFASGATGTPTTIDEESSGIIDVAGLFGKGSFVFDAQVHNSTTPLSNPTTQVEHGQLLLMRVKWGKVFDS